MNISWNNLSLAAVLAVIMTMTTSCGTTTVRDRQYTLKRAKEPKTYITGLELEKIITPSDSENVQVNLFSSGQAAENAALNVLNAYTVKMQHGSRSGEILGDHSWYTTTENGETIILFVFRNGLYQVRAPNYSDAEKSARKILIASTRKKAGVRTDSDQPTFKRPDVSLTPDPRSQNSYIITIQPNTKTDKEFSYRVISSRGTMLDTPDNNRKILITKETGKIELTLVYRNPDNLVSPEFTYKLRVKHP